MGGQACVLYGAAEYSRDFDLAVLATTEALQRLGSAMQSLGAAIIAVPRFEAGFLERGHRVHFGVPFPDGTSLHVDIMSRMRGVDDFAQLWMRRTVVAPRPSGG